MRSTRALELLPHARVAAALQNDTCPGITPRHNQTTEKLMLV
jgi:hypothetical protein